MPSVYKSWVQLMLKISFYDKFKNAFLPNKPERYKGFSFLWRTSVSAILCMGLSTIITYPLDIIHTRISMDLSKAGEHRLYTTTFDCFNRTLLDEGRSGLYKGIEIAIFAGLIRASLTLPIYDYL